MRPDRPRDLVAPAAGASDAPGLTARQREAFGSLADRLARLPASHPSAPDRRAPQTKERLPNENAVADEAAVSGTAAGLLPAGSARGDAPTDGRNRPGGRLARALAASEAAADRRSHLPAGSKAGEDGGPRGASSARGDRTAGAVAPRDPGTAARRGHRPWFCGADDPWFSADWPGSATSGRSG